ncbi:MAG TPA: FHA domain-containing protein [Gemmataceae bacterium]|nr:FHA domain-containing protein [Gemmataceae bacterium]
MPAQLVALNDGPSIWLDKPILLVGRHPECDIQIDSRKISRRHCCIAQVSDYLIVRDLGSTNGVRINGVRVVEGRLTAGDELTIGNNRYRVSWDSVAPPVPPGQRQVRDTLRAPQESIDDDLLESCDEPVPLAEPASPRPAAQPVKPASAAPPKQPEQSMILPDKLELDSPSDIFPRPPSHPPQPRPPA